MNEPTTRVAKAVDAIQQQLTDYASEFSYDALSPEAIHTAKVRFIDTMGCLIGAFSGEPGRIARNLAASLPKPHGATVIGTYTHENHARHGCVRKRYYRSRLRDDRFLPSSRKFSRSPE